ncbi:hypothetical protein [Helicobacter sp. WB40]|uniref:hypothetical protein n=1 Tax=Helicobacter sp. WB40 TaxID=3004130 RepID=UPI0022EBE545|nr:hypothetical protein [Helicobacter sp. WB40]MDA3967371.1 hypothetical protein [Helicobacter sp. WB40]
MKYFKKENEYISLEDYDLEYLSELGYVECEESEYKQKHNEGTLKSAKVGKIKELINSYNQAIKPYIIDTPDSEMLTWERQESEAKSYQVSKNPSDAPLLAKLAENRGVSLEVFANKVLEKSTLYREVSSKLIGKRQALEDRVKIATSLEEIEAIKWEEETEVSKAKSKSKKKS